MNDKEATNIVICNELDRDTENIMSVSSGERSSVIYKKWTSKT